MCETREMTYTEVQSDAANGDAMAAWWVAQVEAARAAESASSCDHVPTDAELDEIVGAQRFTFGFPTLAHAQQHAAARIAQGRPAVTYTDAEGVAVCVYGVKGAR